MILDPLIAVSSIDGRYRKVCEELAEYLSEFALIKYRVRVECEYLEALSEEGVGMRELTGKEKTLLQKIYGDFSPEDAQKVKEIEQETNHDVKAVEYFLKERFKGTSLEDVAEWTHFALTSEDVNSVAYGLMLRDAIDNSILPTVQTIAASLQDMAKEHAETPMLARTHGQPASPTTFGKEMRVFEQRLSRQLSGLAKYRLLVKFGGATGNWNAHSAAAPNTDWQKFSAKFIEGFNAVRSDLKKSPRSDLGIRLELNEFTTQIEPHDTYAELFDTLRRINTILIDFSQDMWRYISDGWVMQKAKKGDVGSSTMPHKVNPIDFENAEGNFGVANALFTHFSTKLPVSRLQRDLSDSTVERTFGTALAHSLIAYKSLAKGLGKISVNVEAMKSDLIAHPEVVAEAIQTVLRREGVEVPYEKLKSLTRGREVSLEDFAKFIDELDVSDKVKKHLKSFTPENYVGLAAKIAKK